MQASVFKVDMAASRRDETIVATVASLSISKPKPTSWPMNECCAMCTLLQERKVLQCLTHFAAG